MSQEKIPQQFQEELDEIKNRDTTSKMDVVVGDEKYKPEYRIGIEFAENVPRCICCGENGVKWRQCVDEVIEHGSQDELVMQEIEKKLKVIVKEIEDGMSVCLDCFGEEFKRNRPELYVKIAKEVTEKHNGESIDLSFITNNKKD